MMDLKGPKIRCGDFENGSVEFFKDDVVSIVKEDVIGKVRWIISPSFILKLIAVFLILFIFLSLINFDKIVKNFSRSYYTP